MTKQIRLIILFLALSAACAAIAEIFQRSTENSPRESIARAEKQISVLSEKMAVSLETIAAFNTDEQFHSFFLHGSAWEDGFSYYVTENGRMVYWSDNEPVFRPYEFLQNENGKLINLPNGDFLLFQKNAGQRRVFGLILIRHNYDYENKYLVNEFNPAIGLSNEFRSDKNGTLTLSLPNNAGQIKLTYEAGITPVNNTGKWLYLFALLFGFAGSYLLIRRGFQKSLLAGLVVVALLWAIRTIALMMSIPEELYLLQLFSPQLYASSFFFHSLGDLLINVAFILILAYNFYRFSLEREGKKFPAWISLILLAAACALTHLLLVSLIVNSRISYDVSKPLELDDFSIWAFTGIAILILSLLFISAGLVQRTWKVKIRVGYLWVGIFLGALYSSLTLFNLNERREVESRKLLAQKVEVRQDRVAEYLLEEAGKKIEADAEIAGLSENRSRNTEKISTLISQHYLAGYLARFESNAYICYGNETGDGGQPLSYFNAMAETGKSTLNKNLFFINNENGRSSYIGFYQLRKAKNPETTLVLILTTRILQTAEGFPELFLSGQNTGSAIGDYSIARYNNQSLIYEFGNYTYALSSKDFGNVRDEYSEVVQNGFSHLIYKLNPASIIVVSHPARTILDLITLFSWMLVLLGILALIVFTGDAIFSSPRRFTWNLTRRIQVNVIFVVVLSFVLVGAGTVFYINKKYEADVRKSISDQVNALWFTVSENALPYLDNDSSNVLENILNRFATTTNINFNVFNESGDLIFSSQPKIFNENIISPLMNPEAYFEIREKGLTQFIHPENAGKLKYLAGYAPITNRNGEIKAFLGLPYFEKQNELNREVSGFLSALLNIYVFLLAVAIFLTVFISTRITQPLLLIQEKMSGIRLGSANEQIEYRKNDEIGQLVKEYNRMIDELALSAGKLAQSERETAWREMARQVAHEIKNPLTPMKLSVQHLQRTLMEKGGSDKEFVDRISGTLIQQIDTLANIATAFSDFARMPQATPEIINPVDVLRPLLDLYSEIPTLEISLTEKGEDVKVMADKDQLNRIFNNILRNAMQAIPDDVAGKISVNVEKKNNSVLIKVSDNGKGIPDDQKDKIFKPNFTTKSSGMGLGLAMVKNLVDQAGGTVWFESRVAVGTTFYIEMPLVSNQ